MFIGHEESAGALRRYCETGRVQELVQVLNYAQFPRPMEERVQM